MRELRTAARGPIAEAVPKTYDVRGSVTYSVTYSVAYCVI